MPWRIEDELKKLGANYVGLWRGVANGHGNLITGQQTFFRSETAGVIVGALGR